MTEKQAAALKKAQEAAKAKKQEAAFAKASENAAVVPVPKFDEEAAYKQLNDRIDNLTVMMTEIRDMLKARTDLSCLSKFK